MPPEETGRALPDQGAARKKAIVSLVYAHGRTSLAEQIIDLRAENETLKAAIDSALQTTWAQDEEGGWGTSEDRLHADRLTALAALQPFWQDWGDGAWEAAGRDLERAQRFARDELIDDYIVKTAQASEPSA